MKEALAEVGYLKSGGRIVNKGFADDMAVIAKSQEELQNMGDRLVDIESMKWKSTSTDHK